MAGSEPNGDVATRLTAVRERIAAAVERSQAERDVCLVAVSKKKPASAIREAAAAGCLDFGENYVQELADKASELTDTEGLRWHYIGHLQRNKVKALLETGPVLIHGVDSARLLREIDKRTANAGRGRPSDVLVQVNVSGEASKSGCDPASTESLLTLGDELDHVRVRGLMTMPPPGDDEQARRCFRTLREIAERLGRDALPELSMGMSQDFEIAIEEGATIVRVGSAIFGARS